MDESRVTFDGPGGWAKGWILSYSDMLVDKKRQQGDNSVMKNEERKKKNKQKIKNQQSNTKERSNP